MEEKPLGVNSFESRFGGHQKLEEREKSFYAHDQTLHCGFVKGPPGFPSTGFDFDEKDMAYMSTCRVAVSSCILGSSDLSKEAYEQKTPLDVDFNHDFRFCLFQIGDFSKKNVCFVMFVDEQTLSKLASDGHVLDNRGFVGLWSVVVVRNLPYKDMRRTGKVPKFLSHRIFPSSSYGLAGKIKDILLYSLSSSLSVFLQDQLDSAFTGRILSIILRLGLWHAVSIGYQITG
ncbi:hypothetical protein NC651_023413 [Populus alba x Populus x berolinensis]|nr:hypothetical protein NC651_023413 [Populus alba x Populus x berolinensis]